MLLHAGKSRGRSPALIDLGRLTEVIVNAEPTGMDDIADVVLRGSIGELLPELFN